MCTTARRNQKIHWVSEPGSASYGIEVANRGQIRFQRKGAAACKITLTISYEVPDALAPFANVRQGPSRPCHLQTCLLWHLHRQWLCHLHIYLCCPVHLCQ